MPNSLILIVGMHRSGTSLLGSLLPHLGVALPGELIGPDQCNATGYFERSDVVHVQESLLISLDRFWAGPRGAKLLPNDWLLHPATQVCRQGLSQLLQRESRIQTCAWAIKDPRSSVFLPLWRELCRQLSIPLRLVLAVRTPDAVVASLMARDERIAGMTWWRAQQLWWYYNTSVLSEPLGEGESPPIVIHYERWFTDPESQALALAAALELPVPKPAQIASIKSFIRPEYRHQECLPAGSPPIDQRLSRLHAFLNDQITITCPIPFDRKPLQPRRPLRQQIAHSLDWIFLLGFAPLSFRGLLNYRRSFLQGEGSPLLISLSWITRQRPQLAAHLRDPLAWYLRCGWSQGVSPHPLLHPASLWNQVGRCQEPVSLYRFEASHDDVFVHPMFDPVHYGRQCLDVDIYPSPTPLEHYLGSGWQLGLAPHPAVDPLWMKQRYGLPGEPLTALFLDGCDITDPGLTHPCGNLHGAALGHPRCIPRLPPALVDLLQFWHARELFPAHRWLETQRWQYPLPSIPSLELLDLASLARGLRPQPFPSTLPNLQNFLSSITSRYSWRVQQMLLGCSGSWISTDLEYSMASTSACIHFFDNSESNLIESSLVAPVDCCISLSWPLPERLSDWLKTLRQFAVVLDPNSERAAFLQLFGVPSKHQLSAPVTLDACSRSTLILQAQQRLGLPDPRWFRPPPALAVVGSSGQAQERRWGRVGLSANAADLLLLPRLPQLVLSSLEDAQALQAWLDALVTHCDQVLLLEHLADGACRPAPSSAVLGPEAEQNLLSSWEERCLER